MKTKRSKLLRAAVWMVAGGLALTGLIGFAHTEHGRPLLAWLGAVPGCPVLANSDPLQVEQRRVPWAARNAGASPAPARPALGFELGLSRRAEVETELERRGASCKAARKDSALECESLGEGQPEDDGLLLFDGAGRLVAVDVFRRRASSAEALRLLAEAEAELAPKLGPATGARGRRDAKHLGGGRFRQVVLEYRYSDYSARVAATNFGPDLRVREQYDWLARSTSGS